MNTTPPDSPAALAKARTQAFFAAYANEARKPHCSLIQRDWMLALLLRAEEAGIYKPEETT